MAANAVPRLAIRGCTRTRPAFTARQTQNLAAAQPASRCFHRLTVASSAPVRHRPTAQHYISPVSSRVSAIEGRRTIFIQTEETPNADALKFNPHTRVLPEGFSSPFLEYISPRSTLAPPHPSPLAAQLHNVDGVTSVFFGADYITVTKDSSVPWAHIKPEVFSIINEFMLSGQPMINTVEDKAGESGQEGTETDSLAYDENDSEIVSMIKELLDTRIRPAIQEDGGDIEFRGYQDGQVLLKLRGACRTCDSSTVTLKNGIESMLMHYIGSEDIKGVQQVFDQEEEVAMKEFAKFEEKLKQQKGPDAVAGTVGKGSLDTVE